MIAAFFATDGIRPMIPSNWALIASHRGPERTQVLLLDGGQGAAQIAQVAGDRGEPAADLDQRQSQHDHEDDGLGDAQHDQQRGAHSGSP